MFTRILVPTDFSPTSDAALEYARALARKFGASLHLLHVFEDPVLMGAVTPESYVPEAPETRAAVMKGAQERLDHRLRPSDRLSATGEIVMGSPARAVTDYAARSAIDLIVMGTHGREGIAHLLLGSIAERVVRTAPCPVLTVRQAAEAAADAATDPSLELA